MTFGPLDLHAVEAFVRVAELDSFTRAAEAMRTTQSAVSLKLKRLERRLGCRLIERTPRHVQLSAQGAVNPAGLSFYSVPLLDALKTFDGPKVEVHITNIHKRESTYQKSLISTAATGVIAGLGPLGYVLAIDAIAAAVSA